MVWGGGGRGGVVPCNHSLIMVVPAKPSLYHGVMLAGWSPTINHHVAGRGGKKVLVVQVEVLVVEVLLVAVLVVAVLVAEVEVRVGGGARGGGVSVGGASV